MKKYIFLTLILLAVMAAAAFSIRSHFHISTQKSDDMTTIASDPEFWKKVDSLMNQGLPKSALELVNTRLAEAEKQGDMPEYLKASIYQLRLRSDFEENFIENYISETEKLLPSKPEPARQVLHSMVAELYWQYYRLNRYRILDQTVVQGNASADMATWDAAKFAGKVSEHYHASLKNSALLQSVDLKLYDPILEKAKGSKQFRPTLFDFLAHRAMDFFMNDEASLTKPIQPFVMRDAGLLAPPEVFTGLAIETGDTASFHFQAIKIAQQIERFHQNDKNPVPLMDATLKRLEFVKNSGNVPEANEVYLQTLLNLEKKYSGESASADVIEKIARYWYELSGPNAGREQTADNYVIAREWCQKAIDTFPESDAAQSCRILIRNIEEPSLELTLSHKTVPGKEFPFLLGFRNSKQVWFRLVKTDYEKASSTGRNFYDDRNLDRYLSMKPEKEWNITLPDIRDYKEHSLEVIHPALEPGYYLIIASNSPDFSRKSGVIVLRDFWATNISYISRRNSDGSGLFYVLDRETGAPLRDVEVQTFTREYDYRAREEVRRNGGTYRSGADGSFVVTVPEKAGYSGMGFEFTLKNDRLIAENYFSRYYDSRQPKAEKLQTFLFTDRSLYRPGQTVFFKGIVISGNGETNRIVAGNRSEITLYDVNGQKVSSVEVVSNKYGSFSGSFVLPLSGPGGQFRLSATNGNAYLSVEEYKRPKFAVEFLPVEGSYRLNETVQVSGKAESYSGVPVSDAAVSYRVVRKLSWPWLRFGWGWWPIMRPDSEIANGELITGADGSFSISFTAVPDHTVPLNRFPMFSYYVYADVTDINGETRSAVVPVMVSNRALLLGLSVPMAINREDAGEYELSATNLNGSKTPAEVTVEVFSLKEAARYTRTRLWEQPDTAIYSREEFIRRLPADIYLNDGNESAEKIRSVFRKTVNTQSDSLIRFTGIGKWEPGSYLVSLTATDAFGEKVVVEKRVELFSPDAKKIPTKEMLWAELLTPVVKGGETVRLLAGTSVKNAEIHYEVMMQEKAVHHEVLKLSNSQKILTYQVPHDYTGEVKFALTLVYGNRSDVYYTSVYIPDTKHQLDFAFETFRSPLLPGGTEKWKLKITGPGNQPLDAELLAAMYDASLDAIRPHNWYFNLSERYFSNPNWEISQAFSAVTGYMLSLLYPEPLSSPVRGYDALNWFGYQMYNRYFSRRSAMGGVLNYEMKAFAPDAMASPEDTGEKMADDMAQPEEGAAAEDQQKATEEEVQVRRNLNETAFFYPHLTTIADGEVWVEFTVPEALTRWNFMGFAHTESLRFNQFSKPVVTRKELMVTPNLPRFFRDGDKITVRTKISNLTGGPMQGTARLELLDAITIQPVDAQFANKNASKPFELEASGNTFAEWQISIPAGIEAVMVRITAVAGNHSDGEEVMLPVLTNRMLVTETMPLPVNGHETKSFSFDKLISGAGGSTTLRNHRLTLEFTSNPEWYAVQALPYLAERSSENSDQVFNRLYANVLASYIANSSPKIRGVFESWRNLTPDALLSNLEKNQELKNLLLEETPWLMDGKNESEQKQRIALMFDLNRMASEKQAGSRRLSQLQSVNGGWPWFEGMPESRYITQTIVTGFGRLHHLKVIDLRNEADSRQMITKAAAYLSMRMVEDYEKVMRDFPKTYDKIQPGQINIQYLYAMSYLHNVVKPDAKADRAVSYFGNQARKFWTSQNLHTQAMIALWSARNGDAKTAGKIISSLKERAIRHPEMGMYWRDNTGGFYWYQAPVETQALLIELFEEFANDPRSVDEMKTWLLKQKQTQNWPTTRATADAVYALLLRGTDWLQTGPGVTVTLDGKVVETATADNKPEAGTGYFKTFWTGGDIKPGMGRISVSKSTEGPAWGAIYWQYFENLDKVTAHDSPLKVSTKLYIKTNTDAGPVLREITGDNVVQVGQRVVARVELRTDRDLEYVHLKGMRAAGFEPENTLSGYHWNGGLGYYENTRDAASNFFFYRLPKGTWVFEYSMVAAQKGNFSNGVTSVQCMYAPEFAAHSEGIRVEIR